MRFHENEEAVSPVIGVILMVAITVILAAVIAVFVFGMAGSVESTKSVGATAKADGINVTVTYHGGPDHKDVDYCAYSLNEADFEMMTGMDNNEVNTDVAVGASVSFEGTTETTDHVVVKCEFLDGTEQVVLDTEV